MKILHLNTGCLLQWICSFLIKLLFLKDRIYKFTGYPHLDEWVAKRKYVFQYIEKIQEQLTQQIDIRTSNSVPIIARTASAKVVGSEDLRNIKAVNITHFA